MEENMTNGTQNVANEGQQNTVPQQQVPVPQEAPTSVTTAVPPQPQAPQENWFKRNWKKLVAGGAAVGTAIASAVVAYKKGKANGIASVPMPGYDDGSYSPLDPNQE